METNSSNYDRMLFDVASAAVLGVTALAGACAPLYLAGYKLVFGGIQQQSQREVAVLGGIGSSMGDGEGKDDERDVLLPSSGAQSYQTPVVGCCGHGHGRTSSHRRSLAFVIGNMFSAGVMVSAGLCHLLGEAIRDMNRIQNEEGGKTQYTSHAFPWATFLCGCGLLITLCADKLATRLAESSSTSHETSGGDKHAMGTTELSHVGASAQQHHHHRGAVVGGARTVDVEVAMNNSNNTRKKSSVSFITAMLMGVALCFHSLLEGAALGAQETITNSMHIFIAIVSHKGLAAYALGSSLVESRVDMGRFWKVIIPFAVASPIGIFLGYFISDMAQGLGAASLSALASGTFLYVAFMEVIPRELDAQDYNVFMKLAWLLLGFGAMSLLAVWA
jgi:zinc transporter ZupT